MVFDKETILEKYENQFKVNEMQNKHIFHDLYARVGDPEELRGFIIGLMQDLDWKPSVNELTKFEDTDKEGIFRGGRLKPIKSIVKAYKQLKKGPRYPLIWKSFFFIGLGFLAFYIYTLFVSTNFNSNLIIGSTLVFFILALLVYSVKEIILLAMWVKISGIYNIKDEMADVRIVIAADANKKDKQGYDKLQEDVSEIYGVLNKKYVSNNKKVSKTQIVKVLSPRSKQPEVSLMKSVRDIDKQLSTLNKRFINKEISEDLYKEIKSDLLKQKAKSETVLDLLSI